MMKQTGLFGRVAETTRRTPKRMWNGGKRIPKAVGVQCVSSCYYAQQDRCECRCGGKFHGAGNNSGLTGKMDEYVNDEREEA